METMRIAETGDRLTSDQRSDFSAKNSKFGQKRIPAIRNVGSVNLILEEEFISSSPELPFCPSSPNIKMAKMKKQLSMKHICVRNARYTGVLTCATVVSTVDCDAEE